MSNEIRKVKGSLIGVDGNAFSVMAYFSSEAKKQGFDEDYISDVLKEAKSGDYSHLLTTINEQLEA